MFYDAVEDTSLLSSDEEDMPASSNPRVIQLSSQLTAIHRKRAKIRTRKVNMSEMHPFSNSFSNSSQYKIIMTSSWCLNATLGIGQNSLFSLEYQTTEFSPLVSVSVLQRFCLILVKVIH